MTYLLDVNALVALALMEHEFHQRTARWVRRLTGKRNEALATCAITELGFLRVLGGVERYGLPVSTARELLLKLKRSGSVRWRFVDDDREVSHLPAWVKYPKQTTGGHLLDLARANGGLFATLDRGIPGAFVIPAAR